MVNPDSYQTIASGLNFQNPSWDAFVFLFWAVASVVYSFSAGRGRITSILMSVYMSELLVIQAPFLSSTIESRFGVAIYLARLIVFLILFGFLFLALSKYVFRTAVERRGFSSWIFSLLFALLQVGFLISVILSFLPPEMKDNFSPLLKLVFVSDLSAFIWLLLPIAFLVFIGRFVSDHHVD